MDEHLYTTKSIRPTVLWRPGNGRSILSQKSSYRPFTHIVRTVHLEDALKICVRGKLDPKRIFTLCSLKGNTLPYKHPCQKLRILWFGAKQCSDVDEETHDWYGNVQFVVPANLLLERWKHYFLVEMMSAPTHTTSRILITNTDYSAVLPQYDPYSDGGPWKVGEQGNLELSDCLRYNNKGKNKHGHTVEFMIEVTNSDQKRILKESELSFRNHSKARDMTQQHVCHRFQKSPHPCPTPVTNAVASRLFFQRHLELERRSRIAKPRLSDSAAYFLGCLLKMEGPRRPLVPVPSFDPAEWPPLPPSLSHASQQSQFFFNVPQGFISVQNHLQRCSFGVNGPEELRYLEEWRYIPRNEGVARASRQRQRQQEEDNEADYNQQEQLPSVHIQGHPHQFQLTWNQNHPRMLGQTWNQNHPRMFGQTWNQNHPRMFGQTWNQNHPRMFGQTWNQNNPRMFGQTWNQNNPRMFGQTWNQNNPRMFGQTWNQNHPQFFNQNWNHN